MNEWQQWGSVGLVILGAAYILVSSSLGHPVDGNSLTAFGLVSTYLLNEVRRARNDKRDKEDDDAR